MTGSNPIIAALNAIFDAIMAGITELLSGTVGKVIVGLLTLGLLVVLVRYAKKVWGTGEGK